MLWTDMILAVPNDWPGSCRSCCFYGCPDVCDKMICASPSCRYHWEIGRPELLNRVENEIHRISKEVCGQICRDKIAAVSPKVEYMPDAVRAFYKLKIENEASNLSVKRICTCAFCM